jgi:uncharacterized membrane protein HdeD (DUF308 family)
MDRDARIEAAAASQKRLKWIAIVGLALFFCGGATTFATWVLHGEVWLISGIAALIGIFLMVHSRIARSTDMG